MSTMRRSGSTRAQSARTTASRSAAPTRGDCSSSGMTDTSPPPQRWMVTRGAARLEVLVQGEGRPIVLLPSLGRGANDFDAIAVKLANAGYRVLRPQPRGIEASRGPWEG